MKGCEVWRRNRKCLPCDSAKKKKSTESLFSIYQALFSVLVENKMRCPCPHRA